MTARTPVDREAAINTGLAIVEREPVLAELIDLVANDDGPARRPAPSFAMWGLARSCWRQYRRC